MPISRKLWGYCVLALGILWICGFFAILQGQMMGWLWFFCGTVLFRLGYNLTRKENPNKLS